MANPNIAHGLRWIRRIGGGPEESRPFAKLAAYGTAIFIGDVVIQVAGDATQGPILNAWAGATPGTTAPSGVSLNYSPASTLATVASEKLLVNIDYLSVFEAQDDGVGGGFVQTMEGQNANITQDAGSTTTGISGEQIGEASINTSASRDVHLYRLFPDVNNAYGPNARIEVIFNHHRMHPSTAGV